MYLTQPPPNFIKLLAHDLRWHMLKALTIGDYRVQELVDLVEQPMNLVSYHLKKLRDDGLVYTRRSDADGRDVYYSLDLDNLLQHYRSAGAALHPAFMIETRPTQILSKSSSPVRVLFVCTHNSARSQMAEAWMRHLAPENIVVNSAGSHPTQLHKDAIRTMQSLGIDIRAQESKHLREFEGNSFDYIITVCDLAREACPSFPGNGLHLHWGFHDPARIQESGERSRVFEQTALRLKSRIEYFLTNLSSSQR